MTDIDHDTLPRLAGLSVQKWAHELSRRLSVDDAWRLMLAGVIAVATTEHTPAQVAGMLRQAADLLEQDDSGHDRH